MACLDKVFGDQSFCTDHGLWIVERFHQGVKGALVARESHQLHCIKTQDVIFWRVHGTR